MLRRRSLLVAALLFGGAPVLRAQEALVAVTEAGRTGATLAPRAVLTALTVPALAALLAEQGLAIEGTRGDTLVLARHAATPVVFQLLNDGQIVRAAVAHSGPGATLAAANAWNRSMILSRVYVAAPGAATCELELDLEGGVTGARVRDFVRTVMAVVPAFTRHIGGEPAGR